MSNGIAWARATPAETRVEASAATRKAERNVRIGLSLLQELRRALRTVHGDVARRAVAGDAVDVREDERTAHLRVAGDAAGLAGSRLSHRVLGRAAVRVVAGHAGKRALF